MSTHTATVDLLTIKKTLDSHPFITPKFLQSYHIQTICNRWFPYFKTKLPAKERLYFSLSDGSQIAADCFFQRERKKHPTIIVINGFTGSSTSFFSRSISHKIFYYGFNVILLMQRGEGDTIHLTKSLFTSYPQNDLPLVLEELHKKDMQNMYIIGLSAGAWSAVLTACVLGEKAKKYLSGIVGISTPGSISDVWDHIDQFTLYSWLLLQSYKWHVRRRVPFDPPGTWNVKTLKKIKTKKQFFGEILSKHTIGSTEKKVTLDEYIKISDIKSVIQHLAVPTLIIHAADDPVTSIKPFLHIKNPNIITLLTRHGGHGGFVTTKRRYNDLDLLWAQNRALEFIRLINS